MKRTFLFTSGFACLLVLAGLSGKLRGASLRIAQTGNQVIVSWPTGAVGYVLESAPALGTGAVWTPFTNPPVVAGEYQLATKAAANTARFYRLTAPAATPPTLSGVTATATTIPLGSTSLVSFAYFDPDADIIGVEVTSSNTLGVTTTILPAAWLRIDGTDGRVSLPVRADDLPFGATTFLLRLKDARDGVSTTGTFTLEVTGTMTGGSAPTIGDFLPVISAWNRPLGPFDNTRPTFTYSYDDSDGDIERIRVYIIDPNGSEATAEFRSAAHGIAGTQGTVTARILTFGATNPPGEYAVELTLIDRNGNVSAPATAFVYLLEDGGQPTPGIATVDPLQGATGTLVTLSGGGFDPVPENNLVTLSGVNVEVVEADYSLLNVVVPVGADTGNFVVRNSHGVAFAPTPFTVPPSVSITPTEASIAVGHQQQFEASVVSAPSHLVNWKVNGIPGGNTSFGTISSSGLYAAPSEIPTGGVVTVSAVLVVNTNVTAQAQVIVLPPPGLPGSAPVLASTGGTVVSSDGRAAVLIPANALPANTTISLRVLQGTNSPPPEPGQRILAAVELGPDGTLFNSPVTLVLPLAVAQPPGLQLPLRIFHPQTGTYTDDGLATVAPNGVQALARLSHFSIVVVPLELSLVPPTVPVISSIEPLSGQEGVRVPVRFTGTGLTPDIEIEVRFNNAPTDDIRILPGSFHALGDQAGAILDIQPIPGLDEGLPRIYTLRLRRIGTLLFADINFTVYGLNELIVSGGALRVLNLADSRRYSTLQVAPGGTLTNANSHVSVEVTGPVMVDGLITTKGADGANGALNQGGGGGISALGFGGNGGMGREDNGCFSIPTPFGNITPDPDPYDCADPENFGGDSNLPQSLHRPPQGIGGGPGVNVNILQDVLDAIQDAVACAGTFGLACVQLAVDVYEVADEANTIAIGGPVGKKGFPAAAPVNGFGNGGGGGGGGGKFGGLFSSIRGGGGGGGGAGGWPVSIVTGRDIELAGMISTEGGRGGDGSDDGERIPFTGFSSGYSGGGGGGGSGGRLTLTSADGIHRVQGSHISTAGGESGLGGLRVWDASGFTIKRLVFRSDRREPASGGGFRETNPLGIVASAATPVFLPRAVDGTVEADHRVTTRSLLHIRFKDDRVRLADNESIVQVIQGTQTNEFRVTRTPTFEFSGYIRLFPGFNTLAVQGMHELLRKQVLFLAGADTDGDGLYDGDEAFFGTDPNKADTDDDGLSDLAEVLAGTDPLNPDTDGDGLPDGQEVARGTNPLNPDTDSDGFADGTEAVLHSDPLSSSSVPSAVPQDILFAHSWGANGSFLTAIDPATGAYGLLGPINGGQPFGLEFDSVAVIFAARSDNLAWHDPLANITTPIGSFGSAGGNPIRVLTLTYRLANDTLYGVEDGPAAGFDPTGQLIAIDPGTGVAARVGIANADPIHALVVLRDGSLVAAMQNTPGSDRLVKLDPQTGVIVQQMGAIGFSPVYGMALGTNDVLYGAHPISAAQSCLLTINPATGQGTSIQTIHREVFDLASFAFKAVPPLVSINRFGSAAGNGASYSWHLSANGRFAMFTSDATDLVSLPDTNGTSDVFVRDLDAGVTELISVNQAGTAATAADPFIGGAQPGELSSDGRYALFQSWTTDLVPNNDFNGLKEVFRRDRLTGVTELVSITPGGQAGSGYLDRVGGGNMSADGRYVAFVSWSDGIVQFDDHNGFWDVFVRDMQAGTTRLASRDNFGSLDGPSDAPLISANGQVVVFNHRARDSTRYQIYARDLVANTLTEVTRDQFGNMGYGDYASGISADGRYVVFATPNPALDSRDINQTSDVFRFDLQNNTNVLVSVRADGTHAGNGQSYQASISADGRFVAFTSYASNLVSVADTNDTSDVFVRDMQTGTTTLVSINSEGTATGHYGQPGLPGSSFGPVISADGRRVLYSSYATNLVDLPPGISSRSQDVYVRDLVSGTTTLLSANYRGTALGSGPSAQGSTGSLSSNGQVAVFFSTATNLVRIPDRNASTDAFVRRLQP